VHTVNPLFKKLLMKPGYRVAILHAPADFPKSPAELPEAAKLFDEGTIAAEPANSLDLVLLFVSSAQDVAERLPRALAALKPGGLLWIAYPKKSSKIKTDISRDYGWDAAKAAGLVGVALISVDDTWSAMRFRRSDEVGK